MNASPLTACPMNPAPAGTRPLGSDGEGGLPRDVGEPRSDSRQPLSSEREIQSAYAGDEAAAAYVARRFESELHRLLHERQVGAVNAIMRSVRPARALEIAPGPGRVTRDVTPAGELTCLEFNEGMIAEGRRACGPQVRWVRGNAFDLPFRGEFDFVYSFRFLRHFRRGDRERLYAQIRRVLRPGGWLVFDAVNRRLSEPLRAARPEDYPIYDKLYDPEALSRELEAAGLPLASRVPVQRAYRWQEHSQIFLGPRAPRLNRWIVRGLERLSPGDGLEWIVTCRRA